MRIRLFAVIFSALVSLSVMAQNAVNTDSIKAEMDKIEITNEGMKSVIEKYKKGVIKGDLESMNLLGMECMTGKYVKPNMEIGLNLLDAAAKKDYVDAQYNLGNYFFIFWARQKDNDGLFTQGVKWLRKAVKGGSTQAIIMLSRFQFEYGKHKKDPAYLNGAIKLLETYPNATNVNDKDEQVLSAQAWLGTINLAKWRMENDTTALHDAKKWYRTLLKSKLEFPNFTQYIDSLQTVLSQGVPMRIDPLPTAEQIEQSKNSANMGGFPGGFGGFPGGGRGGFPGGQPGGQPQGPPPVQATFLGGQQGMQTFIRNNTYYPENLQSQKINGRATVSFTVDTDGAIINPQISNHAVANNVEIFILDQEALRTVMVMPDWIPAEQDGKTVQAKHTITVSFGSGGMGGFGF